MILVIALLCVVLPLSIILIARNNQNSSNNNDNSSSEAGVTDESITAEETTTAFSIVTANGGEYTKNDNIYTLTHSGTYTLTIKSYDDGLHANYGTAFADGNTGTGTINITGGTINIGVYSTETKTAQGNMGPMRPWATTSSTGADGIHADYKLNISGGTIIILGALGERGLTRSGVSTYNLSLHTSGSHTVKINGTSYTFNNAYSYGKTICYSSVSVSI